MSCYKLMRYMRCPRQGHWLPTGRDELIEGSLEDALTGSRGGNRPGGHRVSARHARTIVYLHARMQYGPEISQPCGEAGADRLA